MDRSVAPPGEGRPSRRGEKADPARAGLRLRRGRRPGIGQATLRPTLASPSYNIGEGRLSSFDEILATIRQLRPEAEIREVPGERQTSPYAEASQPMDISRARRELGYEVKFPLPRGLEDYLTRLD